MIRKDIHTQLLADMTREMLIAKSFTTKFGDNATRDQR